MAGSLAARLLAGVQCTTGVIHGLPIVGRWFNVGSALLSSVLRLGSGTSSAKGLPSRKELKPLVLYEYEACPFCAKVREAMTVLDLDCLIYPTPRETLKKYGVAKESRFRGDITAKHGGDKLMFPFFIDENVHPAVKMYQSDSIVSYLWKTYGGDARAPLGYRLGSELLPTPLKLLSLMLSRACRFLPEYGMLRTPSRADLIDAAGFKPLELWSVEGSPFCKIVRERLCTLEIPYICRNMARGSEEKRAAFSERFGGKLPAWRQKAGLAMLPWLVDPNTQFSGGESADLVAYLQRTYGTGEDTVRESFTAYTTDGATRQHGTMPGARK